MPGVICPSNTQRDDDNLIDCESGIEGSGSSENGIPIPSGFVRDRNSHSQHSQGGDNSAPLSDSTHGAEEREGRGHSEPSLRLGDDLRNFNSGGRRASWQPLNSAETPESLLSNSVPSGVALPSGGHPSIHLALRSVLATCATPTFHAQQDVSQVESNQDEGGQSPKPRNLGGKGDKSPSRNKTPTIYCSTQRPIDTLPSVMTPITIPSPSPDALSESYETDSEKKVLGHLSESVDCPNKKSHHQGNEMINVVYELPIDKVFTLLFTNSKFMLEVLQARKSYDVVASDWQGNAETNQKIRQVTYTMSLPTISLGPKVSHVTETQVMSTFGKSREIYTIDAEACNSGIPYADHFYVSNHWCLTRVSANKTRLAVWSEVKYKKNVWGFMKSVIDKNSYDGVKGLMNELNIALLQEVDTVHVRRRRRRGGSKGGDLIDPTIQLPQGDKVKDSYNASYIPSRRMTLLPVSSGNLTAPINSSVRSAGFLFLCVLLAVNAFLYYRLYALEERVVVGIPPRHLGIDPSLFRKLDDSSIEDWVGILQEQEAIHAAEVEQWRTALSDAADYLRKAEESLRNLHASIPHNQANKLKSLLNHLRHLKQRDKASSVEHREKNEQPRYDEL